MIGAIMGDNNELSWVPINNIDVTADQSAIDGLTAGLKLTDYTTGREGLLRDLPPRACTVQVGFYGEALADATSSFGCELWAGDGRIAQQICDITGLAGPYVADLTNKDATTRVFYDDLTVGEFSMWGADITSGGLLSDGLGYVEFTSKGMRHIFPRFYNVGDTTEVKRIKALMRTH